MYHAIEGAGGGAAAGTGAVHLQAAGREGGGGVCDRAGEVLVDDVVAAVPGLQVEGAACFSRGSAADVLLLVSARTVSALSQHLLRRERQWEQALRAEGLLERRKEGITQRQPDVGGDAEEQEFDEE